MAQLLTPSDLTLQIDPASLGFTDTSELPEMESGWIGQERAQKAAQFGLMLDQPDYNLFVLGEAGCGRSSLLFRAMQDVATQRLQAPDLVYVFNFEQEQKPVALRLKPGQGSVLRQSMADFARTIATDVPRKLDEEGFRLDRERLRKACSLETDRAYTELSKVAAGWHYALRREEGRLLFTLLDDKGQAMQEDAVLVLPSEQRVALELAEQELRGEIAKYLEKIRPSERELEVALSNLRRDAIKPLVESSLGIVRAALDGQVEDGAKFEAWLARLQQDMLDAAELFPMPGEEGDGEKLVELLARYRVNLVVDNRDVRGAPVLRDDDPMFRSLFGGIDYQAEAGALLTDFTRIRAGNLLKAHGGFLMLHLRDLIRDEQVWEKLRRFLRNGRLQIEEPAAASGQLATATLEPEALDLHVKIVLIGTREQYYELQELDAEFMRHFRVKVDFSISLRVDQHTHHAGAAFVAQVCRRLGLPHFDAAAVALLLHYMQREVDDRLRQSAAFGRLEALAVESAAHCRVRRGLLVGVADVQTALDERNMRHAYPEESMHEAIIEGELLIRVQGGEVGRLNGLTQIDLGDYRFGSPVCISARAYAGDEGIINIDREVEMTGPNHDKGIFILKSWLSSAFAKFTPLSLSASLVFEQEYHGVEGDSASCAELYALLSALSGLPLAQGLAVTGALNQHGEVLPIGGINEKIEGYFRVCKKMGLDGKQGVIIPKPNLPHLILDRQVVEAVAAGQFNVYAIATVLEGIALLTGIDAGSADAAGCYPPESVMGHVQQTLENFRKACDESGHHDKEHRDKDHHD